MKVVFGKTLSDEDNKTIRDISNECNILSDTARLLFYRGITSPKSAKRFLDPSKKDLHDPYLLLGMRQTVDKIIDVKEKHGNVLIFGDYDADGISATTVLYYSLKEFGIKPFVAVPEREDGYGINVDKILKINEENHISLLITVDCGISDNDKIEQIKKCGIDVVVTDHHEPPDVLPDCVKINPKIKGQDYPFTDLCGAGVAYKLAYALIGDRANDYLDFVALATVADSVDLIDENRIIVYLGLKILNSYQIKLPFKYILGENFKNPVTSQTLAYIVAPRVNAGGRMGNASSVLNMFISDNSSEVYNLAIKLNEYNIARQAGCDLIYREAKEIIAKNNLINNSVLLVKKEGWSSGFIGIVASRLVEDYNRPVIVFAGKDGVYKGSCRSIDGINIYDALLYSSEYLLGFGGHSQAAGVSVNEENFAKFEKKICEYVSGKYEQELKERSIYVDWEVESEISLRFSKEMDLLEPFGTGNKKPLFCVRENEVFASRLKENSPHYSFETKAISMLNFNGENDVYNLSLPIDKFIIFEVNYSVYKNKESTKGIVKKIENIDSLIKDVDVYAFENEINKITLEDKPEYVETDTIDIKKGYGRLYVISDPENLNCFDVQGLKTYYFDMSEKNPINSVLISPRKIPDNYIETVYLDTPIAFSGGKSIKTYVNVKMCGYGFLNKLSLDRETFSDVYKTLLQFIGQRYNSFSEIYLKNEIKFNFYQFIFSAKVFEELGIFYFKEGYIKRNSTIKSQLINSQIYNRIQKLVKDI